MASLKNIKLTLPMPKFCPDCNIRLTSDNAELDHIVPRALGGTNEPDNLRWVCKTCNHRKADNYKHLLHYYANNMSNDDKEKVSEELLERIVYSLPSFEAFNRYETLRRAEKRLLLYNEKINTLNKGLPEEVRELAEAYEDYDFSSEKTIELNGNFFTYRNDFPIDQYKPKLSVIGNQVKGYTWYVEINEDGEVELKE